MVCAVAEEELDKVPFVGLSPVESVGGDGTDIQAIDMDGIGQLFDPGGVLGHGGADQGWTDTAEHIGLWAVDDGGEGEHVFFGRDFAFGGSGVDDHGSEVGVAFLFVESRSEVFSHIGNPIFAEIFLDHLVGPGGHGGVGEGGEGGLGVRGGRFLDRADAFGEGFGDFFGVA